MNTDVYYSIRIDGKPVVEFNYGISTEDEKAKELVTELGAAALPVIEALKTALPLIGEVLVKAKGVITITPKSVVSAAADATADEEAPNGVCAPMGTS